MKSVLFDDYSFLVPGQTDRTAVQGFLEPQQSLHVSGASGVGKTTFLRSVAGLLGGQERGSPVIQGRECVGLVEPKDRSLSVVFQGFQLFAHLNVEENLLIAFERQDSLRHLSRELKRERIDKILARLQLSDKITQRASDLSGGEHQRVAIARALLSRAPVVLLDEPFSALDKAAINRVVELLQEYQSENQATFLGVSHRRSDFWTAGVKELIWKDGQTWLNF